MIAEREITKDVESYFGTLQESLKVTNPGILDLLEVYGGYEGAVREANAYLASLEPVSVFSTTNSSGQSVG